MNCVKRQRALNLEHMGIFNSIKEDSVKLLYPCTTEEALNILRTKGRPDLFRRDASGAVTLYTNRELAQHKAMELRRQGRERIGEMALVIIEVDDPALFAHLCPAEQTTPSRLPKGDGTVLLHTRGQDVLSRNARFSLEIVPDTENWLATYGNRAPECGVGIGPWK